VNRIIIYLYRNSKYGINEASFWHFVTSKIGFLLVLLLWFSSILTYMDRKLFDKKLLSFINGGGVFFCCCVFLIGMYFILNKHFVTLAEAESAIADPDKQDYINKTKWIFWILILIPLLIILAAGKKY
jgi:hypothetical protein